MPDEDLKPGMTAEVKIKAGELSNVLIVPVQAVAEHKGEFFAFVDRPPAIERRKVKVGDTNEKMVQVLDGLKEGERVTLDARSRAVAEFKLDESSEEDGQAEGRPQGSGPRSRQAKPLSGECRYDPHLLPAGEGGRRRPG